MRPQYRPWAFGWMLAVYASGGLTQVTLDGTLGPAGSLSGPDYAITPDLGQQRGGNLFHSFGQFSIHTGESATFSGPNSVNNIIGRVTGGETSLIDGTIRSTIPGANLYLLNPAGVLFGENATLDVPGSVHVSTADYLRLSDGGRFDARTPANSVLTVAPVAAFGFLGGTPGRITVEGAFLQVPEGQTLSLIGGDITLTNATLYAPAGRINVAAVASAGEVIPTDTDLTLQGFDALGTFTIERTTAERPIVDLGEPWGETELGNLDTSGTDGGSIFIRGGQWVSRGGLVFAETYGNQNGRGIHVVLSGEMQLENNALISTSSASTGDAGPITLDVGRLSLTDGSNIFASAFGTGRGGDITINANDAVTIAGLSYLCAMLSWENATAGTIRITTPQLILDDGSIISPTSGKSDGGSIELNVERLILTGGSDIITSTYGSGNAGEIIINASEAVVITSAIDRNFSTLSSNAGKNSTGNAGMIRITTPLLTLGKGGGINSSTYKGSTGNGGTIDLEVGRLNLTGGGSIFAGTSGAGRGGEITVNANERINITDTSALSTNADGTGNAGTIQINTPLLALEKSGHISSSTTGAGNGGSIELNVGRLSLTGGSTILSVSIPFLTSGISELGEGGEIIVNASEGVTITDTSALSTNAGGTTGNAGNITVTTPNLILADGGKISAKSTYTTGGNILINADHLKLLNNGTISSSVFGNEQSDGGNVTINNTNFVALNGSSVTAQANQGRGGNILVNAQVFLHDAADVNDVLNASSQVEGNDGNVQNNAPTTDISGSLVALDTNYLDAAGQLTNRCAEGDRDSRSRFTIQGRGALPPDPDAALPAPGARCEPPPATLPSPMESPGAASSQSVTIAQSFGFGDR